MKSRLSPIQAAVAERELLVEEQQRHHLVVHLSGAHAYGFPSPDSDLDLKAVHLLPTHKLLGLRKPRLVAQRLEFVDGVEIDYSSNELQTCLRGLLTGDGNMLERVLSASPLLADPRLSELRELAQACVSKRYHHHYRGFARSQAKALAESATPSAKKLLYVLRTSLSGVHLLLERESQPDLSQLWSRYGFPEVPELIALKQAGESTSLDGVWRERSEALLERAFARLEHAVGRSQLPRRPPAELEAELVEWLLALRRDNW